MNDPLKAQLELNTAVEKFLKTWPVAGRMIENAFVTQQIHAGVQYEGPLIGPEIEAIAAAARDLGLDVPDDVR